MHLYFDCFVTVVGAENTGKQHCYCVWELLDKKTSVKTLKHQCFQTISYELIAQNSVRFNSMHNEGKQNFSFP